MVGRTHEGGGSGKVTEDIKVWGAMHEAGTPRGEASGQGKGGCIKRGSPKKENKMCVCAYTRNKYALFQELIYITVRAIESVF